jgi:hypothetical protein
MGLSFDFQMLNWFLPRHHSWLLIGSSLYYNEIHNFRGRRHVLLFIEFCSSSVLCDSELQGKILAMLRRRSSLLQCLVIEVLLQKTCKAMNFADSLPILHSQILLALLL